MNKRPALFFLIVILLAVATSVQVQAATKVKSYKYTRIFYYQGGSLARQSLFAHPSSIDVLAPQSYVFDNTGKLSGKIDSTVLAFSKKHHIKVMPLVTNGKFSQEISQAILDNPTIQDSAIAALVTEAKKNGYWGWQIDFEQMDASYRDQYSAFIAKAIETMKENNLVLSVAVVAKISDNPDDYQNNLWQKLIGVYDYSALAASANFISLMSYDDPNSKGPIVEYAWLKQVIAYSIKMIPNNKLSLGIPLYYWQWNDVTGKLVGIGGRQGISNVLRRHKVTAHYSTMQQEPYLTYWSKAKQYTIWYENAQSIKKKISLIKEYKLHGFSAWALGLELPSIYKVL